jgi:hypothetical protein
MIRFALTAVALLLGTAAALPDDRPPLHVEPAYAGKTPQYLLLTFGPKADTRVWVVVDLHQEWITQKPTEKDAVYVDRNSNGDLTDPGERIPAAVVTRSEFDRFSKREHEHHYPVFNLGEVVGRDGTKYTGLTLDVGWYVPGQRYREVKLKVQLPGGEQWAGGPLLRLGDKPQQAPVIRFNGPLAMRLSMTNGLLHCPISYDEKVEADPPWYEERPLVRGKTCDLVAEIGTDGVGRGTFVPITADIPPEDLHPVAEVEFPHRDAGQPSIRVRVELTQRCCGTLFKARLAVPAEAATSKAKVTLSFPAWKAGNVTAATGEVSVVEKN